MSTTSERISLDAILADESLSPHRRVMAGDALRYELMRDGARPLAESVAAQVIEIGTPALQTLEKWENQEVYDALERAYITRAHNDFHSYMIALEWRRPAKSRFYQPRMMVLREVADALTDLMVNDLYDIILLSMPPRVGKLLADDTLVLTADGWKNHGDLVVGDRVVAPDGRFVPVTHVFPKATADRLVTFSNGEQIQCHAAHEWVLYDRSKGRERTLETRYIEAQQLDSGAPGRGHRYRLQLLHKTPMVGEHRNLPLDPYTLGVWLGDGTNTKPLICGARADVEIIRESIPYSQTWEHTHPITGVYYAEFKDMREGLHHYGMCHTRRTTQKHIPDIYLTASKAQRLELLAGLLDTDGSLRKTENRYNFTTCDERLRDDVVSLIATFGWRTGVVRYEPRTSSSGIVGKKPYYVIGFNPTEHIPCRIARKQLHTFSKPRRVALTSVETVAPKQGNCISVDGGVYCVGRQMVPTHNSSLGLFFLSWCIGRNSDSPILATGYAEKITKMFYHGLLETYEDVEYNYREIFPLLTLVNTSANDLTLDFRDDGKESTRKYKSVTCRAIDGSLTGATEARQLLYCDDLVRDIEEALNPTRLQMLRDKMVTNVYSRKKEGCKEVHIGTRWSIHDPIGWVESVNADNPRCKVIRLPALDLDTDESNFHYPYNVGFSTDYYRDLRKREDDVTWQCVYQQQPVEREGLLFPSESLIYAQSLPDFEHNPPDDIFAFCDVAFGGIDTLSMPIAAQWGDDAPVVFDVVFKNGDYKVTEPLVAGTLISQGVRRAVFESNNGGEFYAKDINDILRERGYQMFLVAQRAPSDKSKETRIVQHSPAIKEFTFLDPSSDLASPMYRSFMAQLTSYTPYSGGAKKHKNKDDAPDSLAGLASMMRQNLNATLTVYDRKHI